MLIINDLYTVVPELIIVFGAVIALLLSTYVKAIKAREVCYLGIITILCAICFSCCSHNQNINAFAGTFLFDQFAINMKILIMISVALLLLLISSIATEQHQPKIFPEYPILILLSTIGMCLLISSNSLLILYMGLELMSLPLYIMTACNRTDHISQEAGLKYFVLGALASCIYLYGASIVYGFSGSIDFSTIGNYYIGITVEDMAYKDIPTGFLVGVILILTAICFKMSAVPFHMWTPDVYQGAPTMTTALLASAPKIAALGVLLRLLYGPFLGLIDQLQQIIIFVAVTSMFIGNLGAIMQHDFKRLIAYSAIGHIGFILMGVSSGDLSGIQNAIFYAIIYLTMTITVFALLLMLKKDGHYKTEIKQFAGLATSSPLLAASLAIIMFSMAGIPPFAGFFAKFYILYSIVQAEMYVFAIAGVVATVIGCYYYLKIIKAMYFDLPHASNDADIPLALKILASCGVLINLCYVLLPEPLMTFARKSAENLLGY